MMRSRPKRAQRAIPILTWLTPLGATISVINVVISLCTSEWLKSCERIPSEPSNGTTHRDEFDIKRTVSGLWNLCYTEPIKESKSQQCFSNGYMSSDEYSINTNDASSGSTMSTNSKPSKVMECYSIDYFSNDGYSPEPHDSTSSIPYAVIRAGPLFIIAAILLSIAIFLVAIGHVSRAKRVAMFIGGIVFIISGLVMLIGLVVYLSVLQSEIGTKLRPRNSLEAPLFTYSYGSGFILVVIGFLSTELTGICAIFWYMYWHQLDWALKADGREGSIESSCNSNNCSNHFTHFIGIEDVERIEIGRNGDCNSCRNSYRKVFNPSRVTNDRRSRRELRRSCSHEEECFQHQIPSFTSASAFLPSRNGHNSHKFHNWKCDLHYPTIIKESTKFSRDKDCIYGTGPRRYKTQNQHVKSVLKASHSGSSSHHPPSSLPNQYYSIDITDDDEEFFDYEVPLPPPPPLIPRDLTFTSNISDDPHEIESKCINCNSSAEIPETRDLLSDRRKTTPV